MKFLVSCAVSLSLFASMLMSAAEAQRSVRGSRQKESARVPVEKPRKAERPGGAGDQRLVLVRYYPN